MNSSPEDIDDTFLTLDMVVQYTYCPRRFHLMYVEGRWADNEYVVEGRKVHQVVDKIDHLLPDVGEINADGGGRDEEPLVVRSVPLSSDSLKIRAKLDLVASDGNEAVPVETKRGKVPNNELRTYDTQRVQLMAQGLLLREHGYRSEQGIVYFAGSRTRVVVSFSRELESQTRMLIERTSEALLNDKIPSPYEDDPRCNGCSLAAICMPDETLALNRFEKAEDAAASDESPRLVSAGASAIRRFYPVQDERTPMYIQEQGAKVGKSKLTLTVTSKGEEIARIRLKDISQVALCGNVQISTQTLHWLCQQDIPVVYFSTGMWFYGLTHGHSLRNAFDRAAQFAFALQPERCLQFAKQLVRDKGQNQRTMLRRNASDSSERTRAIREMDRLFRGIESADSVETLLGYEGSVARIYFQQFSSMLKSSTIDTAWDFSARNRRPPRDPVNALLSFAYALLVKECTVALLSEGLDPYWGFYHKPRHGKPALALDLMEPLRPLVADSAVITAINTGMVGRSDFEVVSSGCAMNERARKGLLRAYEARLDHLITQPVFNYRCSWRSVIRMQARLLSRYLRGDIVRYQSIVTR